MHVPKAGIDVFQLPVMSDIFVHTQLSIQIIVNETRNLCSSFYSTERSSFSVNFRLGSRPQRGWRLTLPYTTCDELEWTRRNLLSCCSDSDNDADTPTFVACLQCCAHDMDITCRVECKVESAIGDFNKMILDSLALAQLCRIDKVGSSKLSGPRLLVWVRINGDDSSGFEGRGGGWERSLFGGHCVAWDDLQITPRPIAPHPKTATFEPSMQCQCILYDVSEPTLLTDSRLFRDCTPCCGDTTSEETNFFQRCLEVLSTHCNRTELTTYVVIDFYHRDTRDDRVL